MGSSNKHLSWAFWAAVAVSLLPLANILRILFINGVDNLTNDTLLVMPLLGRVLDGSFDWNNLGRDIFINGHFQFFTLAAHLLAAIYAHSNADVLLSIGIVLALTRVFFLYFSFDFRDKSLAKYAFLAALFIFTFSTSQISTYEFEWNTVMVNLCFLGFAIGVFGLVRFRERPWSMVLMGVGGLLSGWSSASGIMAWASFLLGMILLNYRRKKYYLYWAFVGAVIFLPYFLYLSREPGSNPYSTISKHLDFFRLHFVISSLGYPLAQEFSARASFLRGLLGVSFLVGCLVILYQKRASHTLLTRAAPALMLISFSLLTTWQISIFREGLVPFYTSYFMLFWMGLLGLVFVLVDDVGVSGEGASAFKSYRRILLLLVAGIAFYFYLSSNLSFQDKTATLKTRSPASASCLRNYRTAPTYCESTVFTWYLEKYDDFRTLSRGLEKHRLSVFAPRQKWYLQGDFILDNVKVNSSQDALPVFWTKGRGQQRFSYTDFGHLNLFLQSPNSVEWTVTIPKNARMAELHSAVAISSAAPKDELADGLVFEIIAERSHFQPITLFQQYLGPEDHPWIPVDISLTRFSGETLVLKFVSDPIRNNRADWGIFKFPYIDVDLSEAELGAASAMEAGFHPSNTDLAELPDLPSEGDFAFDVTDPKLWSNVRMQALNASKDHADTWVVENDPIMEYQRPLDVDLRGYSRFYVKMATTAIWKDRVLQVYYRLDDQKDFDEARSFKIPLINDGAPHDYTFDLRLLGLAPGSHLTGIRLDPVLDNNGPSSANTVRIFDFRLLKDKATAPL